MFALVVALHYIIEMITRNFIAILDSSPEIYINIEKSYYLYDYNTNYSKGFSYK